MDIQEELKKIIMAGVGAVAVTSEKAKALIDELVKKGSLSAEKAKDIYQELVKKGEETVEQGKVVNEELKRNIQKTCDKVTDAFTKKSSEKVMNSVDSMTKEELVALQNKINEALNAEKEE